MAASTVTSLTQEVADLLRHDNLDSRILTWLALAYQDICTRVPTWLFHRYTSKPMTTKYYRSTTTVVNFDGEPLGAIWHDGTTDAIRFLEYVTEHDYRRMTHDLNGTAFTAIPNEDPKVWTIIDQYIYVYPWTATGGYVTYFYATNGLATQPRTSTERMVLPYHWEHVLVWGAAAFGIRALRPELYPIYAGEYEEALNHMISLLNYKPDSTPALRSITGPFGSFRGRVNFPRIPDNITP